MQIGIVGLPNVGKSTLFNALTKTKGADAQNYPFCTIDPNIGIVEVPDERMKQLTEVVKPQKVIPTTIEFIDIAGIVKGAHEGEGLGNQFLSHIRECDAIAEVVRVFENGDIIHVNGKINPQDDVSTIEMELVLADMHTVQKRLKKAISMSKSGDKKMKMEAKTLSRLDKHLSEGNKAIDLELNSDDEKEIMRELHLLTNKPFLYIANTNEDEMADFDLNTEKKKIGLKNSDELIPISAKLEEELIELNPTEANEFLESLGLKKGGLDLLIQSAYRALNLRTYFTAGVQEVRAWTIPAGALAPQAAGVIHTDFEKGFIKAEVVFWKDLVKYGGEQGAKEKGLLRIEGKDYEIKDGDVCHFRFNV